MKQIVSALIKKVQKRALSKLNLEGPISYISSI